ncbi:hypothetical protein H0H10_04765 [Streptomyces sp. TRM S81-3]|uniref:Uncharacterized protein n=1 Tax=Streptomyces griseicoloratus TaxID=2752516 RepID=A0A926KX81_9ACTN|nr:hypothetical protein [Streptomyces griseicoloratus]MBD0418487.1 hypothetical protein [Streptomyces griseicoloratus]
MRVFGRAEHTDVRGGRGRDAGQGAVEYLGVVAVAGAVVLALAGTALGTRIDDEIMCQVQRVTGTGGCGPGDTEAAPGPDDGLPPGGDPFQPAKCLLSSEETKDTVVVQVLFLKISSTEQVKVQQWSDGSVTLERVATSGAGVTASVEAGIPGLEKWGGGASLGGSYVKSSGSGGRWLFHGHKSGDRQKDLAENLADAKQFAEYLKAANKCRSRPPGARSAELGMICGKVAEDKKPDVDPEKAPDIDITKTTTEVAGEVSFGGKYAKDDKAVKSLKDDIAAEIRKNNPKASPKEVEEKIKKAQDTVIGSTPDTKDMGNGSIQGLSGTMSKDVVVMRAKTGPDAGKITFVYTFEMGGKFGAGAQAGGTHMQQIAVTYDAAAYDRETEEGLEHRPEKLKITTSQESSGGPGVNVGAGVNTGPVTIEVGGGGGKTETRLHTEIAEITLGSDEDRETVEDWIRGRGDNPAEQGIPSPHALAGPLPADAGPIDRLLHDKAQITSLDYDVDTDWWNASLGIGFGLSAGSLTVGFKLFGIDVTHEERTQTITGNPAYAGAPSGDGSRPWKPFTNCSDTEPIIG